MKTKAAILKTLSEPLEIWELEIPSLARGQVLVEIAYSGVCRTQLNEIKGFKGHDPYLPHTLGHEGSGIVREIGEGVTKIKVGDHVVLSWIKGVGIEAGGSKYTSLHGVVNSGAISTFLQYAIISENRLIPIPKELPLREAALLGCAIPTGAGVVFNQLKLAKDHSFATFGLGGVGLSAILAAKYLGAHPIIAVDVSEEKLAQAKAFGATHTINARLSAPALAVREATEGKGADGVLECVGRADAMEEAFQATSPKGTCVIAGNLPKGEKIHIDPFDLIAGKKILGSWGGSSVIDQDISRYTELVLAKQFPIEKLISHEMRLEEINDLLQLLEAGKMNRGLINFNNLN
jgi:S-(hydroxymethyl)glutathione dehydrogenase/alcohol dehydrogenase